MRNQAKNVIKPCADCPYRRDAPLAMWDKAEFDNLRERDASYIGAIFSCHHTVVGGEGKLCGGWLLDQRARGYPSIAMRVALIDSKEVLDAAEALQYDGELYGSISEMCEANFPGGVDRTRDEAMLAENLIKPIPGGYLLTEVDS